MKRLKLALAFAAGYMVIATTAAGTALGVYVAFARAAARLYRAGCP